MELMDSTPFELKYLPRNPVGLFTDEGRRELARMLVWGSAENEKFYDRTQIQRRVEELLTRIARGMAEGKYER